MHTTPHRGVIRVTGSRRRRLRPRLMDLVMFLGPASMVWVVWTCL